LPFLPVDVEWHLSKERFTDVEAFPNDTRVAFLCHGQGTGSEDAGGLEELCALPRTSRRGTKQ